MSVSIEPQGKSGRRSLTAELNLVPYIDLLTCMVAFLLITATWAQLAQLKISQRNHGGEEVPPPMTKIAVVVGLEGINVVTGGERAIVPNRAGEPDLDALGVMLKNAKRLHPDKDDVEIASEDGVRFDRLTGVMDTTIAAGFPAVSLVPSSEADL